jgi:hypothetical protein
MKENGEKIISQEKRENAVLEFVNYQAQEAILNPNLPNDFKDMIVEDAIRKIRRIGEKRGTYLVRSDENHHDIYKG